MRFEEHPPPVPKRLRQTKLQFGRNRLDTLHRGCVATVAYASLGNNINQSELFLSGLSKKATSNPL